MDFGFLFPGQNRSLFLFMVLADQCFGPAEFTSWLIVKLRFWFSICLFSQKEIRPRCLKSVTG